MPENNKKPTLNGKDQSMKNPYLIAVISSVVIGAASFYGGMKFQASKTPNFLNAQGQTLGQGQMGRNQMGNKQGTGSNNGNGAGAQLGFRPIAGEIISQDDKSVNIKTDDGSSKIIMLSEQTKITEASAADKSKLTVGQKITVMGTSNSDGSVTAQNISIGEMGLRMGGDKTN